MIKLFVNCFNIIDNIFKNNLLIPLHSAPSATSLQELEYQEPEIYRIV